MDDIVRVRSGSSDDYMAVILLSRLPQWSFVNLRKPFKIMHSAPVENADVIEAMHSKVPGYVTQAKVEEIAARQVLQNGYRSIPPHSRKPEHVAAREKNRLLLRAARMAKQELERWSKIQSIFNET